MRKVFISYARNDQAAARLIAERLSAAGFSVFFDVDAMVAGESWTERLNSALLAASAVLVLLSSNSRRSTWVQEEVQAALEGKKLVMPVLLDEGAKQNWLWPLVATRQSIELDLKSGNVEQQLDFLVQSLSALRGEDTPLLSGATKPPSLASFLHSIAWKSVAIAVGSAAVGALASWLLR